MSHGAHVNVCHDSHVTVCHDLYVLREEVKNFDGHNDKLLETNDSMNESSACLRVWDGSGINICIYV